MDYCNYLPHQLNKKLNEAELLKMAWAYYQEKIMDGNIMVYGKTLVAFENNKIGTFNHITTEERQNGKRVFSKSRTRKLVWLEDFLRLHCQNKHECDDFLIWKGESQGRKSLKLYCQKLRYLVVLIDKPKNFYLLTAYYVDKNHNHEKLLKEYRMLK